MRIAVSASDEIFTELTENTINMEWVKFKDWASRIEDNSADAYFNLDGEVSTITSSILNKPFFVNAVTDTLQELNASDNVCRIVAWPGFLQRNTWEIAGSISEKHMEVINKLNKNYIQIADEPGTPSTKIISMIINEGYFALQDNVSTKEEIDSAMKLGTNYPYGPFEWSKKIGLKNIYALLQKLSVADKRYIPSSLLTAEAKAL
jgi:3-hydroxybutyryl-CoA dehydrogenase